MAGNWENLRSPQLPAIPKVFLMIITTTGYIQVVCLADRPFDEPVLSIFIIIIITTG